MPPTLTLSDDLADSLTKAKPGPFADARVMVLAGIEAAHADVRRVLRERIASASVGAIEAEIIADIGALLYPDAWAAEVSR